MVKKAGKTAKTRQGAAAFRVPLFHFTRGTVPITFRCQSQGDRNSGACSLTAGLLFPPSKTMVADAPRKRETSSWYINRISDTYAILRL